LGLVGTILGSLRRTERSYSEGMRTLSRLVPLALVAVALSLPSSTPTAFAATQDISISGSAFHSALVVVAQGTTVRWTNNDGITHSTKSYQGFWSSPNLAPGTSYSQTPTFLSAGSYSYYCRQHPTHMIGAVQVPLKAPSSAANGFTLRWSSASSTPSNRGFDIQKKAPGADSWTVLKRNTQTRSMFLNPTRNGTWRFRARTDNRTTGKSSLWSPVKTVSVS
jgi:plastocyanin